MSLTGNVTTANQNITFNSAVTLGQDDTITGGTATTTFGSTVDGDYALTVSNSGGSVVFERRGRQRDALASLNVTGTATMDNNVTTVGTQTYNNAVILGGDDTLTTTNSNVTFASTVDGDYALTIAAGSGLTSFGGAVGNHAAVFLERQRQRRQHHRRQRHHHRQPDLYRRGDARSG